MWQELADTQSTVVHSQLSTLSTLYSYESLHQLLSTEITSLSNQSRKKHKHIDKTIEI